uniref:Skp1-related protein n=1 Tax=Caenorhabditis tropicalis TaxID=1561998 RepID=A0A1I7T8X8_9PELO
MNTTYAAQADDRHTNYIIQTLNGDQFKVTFKILGQSITFANAISKNHSESTPIRVPQIDTPTMEKVLEWCSRHKDDAPYNMNRKNKRPLVLPRWDKAFFDDMSSQQLFDVLSAVTHLKIPKLMDYMCKIIGTFASKKTSEDLKLLFEDNEGAGPASDQPGPSTA